MTWNSGSSKSKQDDLDESETLEEYLSKFMNQRNRAESDVAKIASKSRAKFRPTKVIAISVVHRDFSKLRRLR